MPRLYHTKSKTGCSRCRARRVKCDEIKPSCGGCARHNADCVYDREPPAARSMSVSSSNSNSTSAGTAQYKCSVLGNSLSPSNTSLATESKTRRRIELFLTHLYIVDVTPTLPGAYRAPFLKQWTVDVPRLALDYEPLHNAIMVISLHWMICTNSLPEESDLFVDSLASYRARYLEAVLQDHRRTLNNMTPSIVDPVSFTSILLCIDAFASLRDRHQDIVPYRPPTEWLQMCKGVRSVFSDALAISREMPHSRIRDRADNTASFWEPSLIYNEANRSKFAYLLLRREHEKESNEENDTYGMAVSYIGALLTAHESGEEKPQLISRTLIFPMLLPQRFIESVGLRRPRALVILAHFFAFATTGSHVWWIGDSLAREVQYIFDYLSPEWHDLMRWPLQIIA